MDQFSLRRAVERLRDGLYDPIAVNCLMIGQERIEDVFSKNLKALEKGRAGPLCVCGSYGQGKSHTLDYLNQLALSQGYATSSVQIDIRGTPFHRLSTVYRSIMGNLSLPDGKKFAQVWRERGDKDALKLLETMPHRFKIILTCLLCKTKQLTSKEMSLKKHRAYQPKEYGYWLDKALMGDDVPLGHLKNICKYKEVDDCQKNSLFCRGNDPYFQMIQSLGRVLHEMGYKGLLLLFDEAESITQGHLSQRVKSYHLLDQFFQTKGFVFPLFAFTDDFFDKVRSELYDEKREIFSTNYADKWRDLAILRLSDFSSQEWESLLDRLLELYSQAYQITLPSQIKPSLRSLLDKLQTQETRSKLKALVNKIDIEAQRM